MQFAEFGSVFKAWYIYEFLKQPRGILHIETTKKLLSKIQKLEIPR